MKEAIGEVQDYTDGRDSPGIDRAVNEILTDNPFNGTVADTRAVKDNYEVAKEFLEEKPNIDRAESYGISFEFDMDNFRGSNQLRGLWDSGEEGKAQIRQYTSGIAAAVGDVINRTAGPAAGPNQDLILDRGPNEDELEKVALEFEGSDGTIQYQMQGDELESFYDQNSENAGEAFAESYNQNFELV